MSLASLVLLPACLPLPPPLPAPACLLNHSLLRFQPSFPALPAEAALVHDLAVLWQEQAGGPEAFLPDQLYNFPLPRWEQVGIPLQ